MTPKFDTLEGVIKAYLAKNQLPNSLFFPYLAHAMSWFEERDSKLVPNRTSVELILHNDRTAVLPLDFVDWLSVGREINGALINLGFNSHVDMPTTTELPAGVMQVPTPYTADPYCCCYPGVRGGIAYGWGRGVYGPGEFTIDRVNRTLQASSQVPEGTLILQYAYNPNKPGVATPISGHHKMPLELWIEWQVNRRAPDASRLESKYNQAMKKAHKRDTGGWNAEALYNIFDNTAYGF